VSEATNEAQQGSGNVRLTIYIPPRLDNHIRCAAERAGQSLSVWLQRAALAALRDQGDA
jgi:predicted HicB family RNase H-like nuclease